MAFDANLKSSQLVAEVSGQFKPDQTIALSDRAKARLLLTPQSFAALQEFRQKDAGAKAQAPGLSLMAPAWVEVEAGGTTVALAKRAQTKAAEAGKAAVAGEEPAGALSAIDLRRSRVLLKIKSDDLSLRRAGDAKPIRLTNVRGEVKGENPAEKIEAHLTADLAGQGAAGTQPGTVRTDATASKPVDQGGRLSVQPKNVVAQAKVERAPTVLIDQLMNMQGKLTAAVGPTVSLNGDYAGAEAGRLDLQLNGDNVKWSLPAQVDDDWMMTLREDSKGEFAVTKEFSQQYIRSVNPLVRALSVESVESQQPVKLTIKQQDFKAPLYPFDIRKMSADIDLDLGTLTLDSSSPVFFAMKIIGNVVPSFNKYVSDRQPFEFSPVTLKIRDGVLSYPKMSMTRGNLAVQYDGRVNLVNRKVRMTMGVPGSAINRMSHETRGYIAPEDEISVPFGGTIDQPKFDESHLVREMTALGAKIGIRKAIGGEAGDAVGTILDILGGKKKGNKENQDQAEEDEQKQDEATEDPLSGLLRGILKKKDKKKKKKKHQ